MTEDPSASDVLDPSEGYGQEVSRDILLAAYGETTKLNIHFYTKRSVYLLAFVAAMTSIGIVYINDPIGFWWTFILPLAIGYICLYMDLYTHKRVIITAACLKEIEARLMALAGDSEGGELCLPMVEILAASYQCISFD